MLAHIHPSEDSSPVPSKPGFGYDFVVTLVMLPWISPIMVDIMVDTLATFGWYTYKKTAAMGWFPMPSGLSTTASRPSAIVSFIGLSAVGVA